MRVQNLKRSYFFEPVTYFRVGYYLNAVWGTQSSVAALHHRLCGRRYGGNPSSLGLSRARSRSSSCPDSCRPRWRRSAWPTRRRCRAARDQVRRLSRPGPRLAQLGDRLHAQRPRLDQPLPHHRVSRHHLPTKRAILDGEVIVEKDDRANFSELQADLVEGRHDRMALYAFDCPVPRRLRSARRAPGRAQEGTRGAAEGGLPRGACPN